MPLSRRDLLRAGAAAALTAACAPAASKHGGTATPGASHTPASPGSTGSSAAPAPSATALPAVATEIGHGDRSKQTVALTFHGNGDPALAQRLLGLLEAHQVHASVLAVGTWLVAHPAMAHRITSAGHDLGNHTQHHYPMRGLSATQADSEVAACAQQLKTLTGSVGRWFRASGTQTTTPTIRRAAARGGYATCVSYDVDGLDWKDPGRSTVVDAVLSGTKPGSIVSLHLGHPVTVDALPDILAGLHSRGLRPVTLTELLA